MGVSPLGKDHVWELNLAARAAWMSYIGDLTRNEIAKRLGVSSARVHRLITLAREKGMVRISIEGRPSECLEMEDSIAQRFNLESCTISPYLRNESDGEDIAIAAVGQVAGQLLGQHLLNPEVKSICIGSGRTLMAAVNALPIVPRPDLNIYPASGSLVDGLALDPYDVISQICERTGGKGYQLPVPRFAQSQAEAQIFLKQAAISSVINNAKSANVIVSGIASEMQVTGGHSKATKATQKDKVNFPVCVFLGRALNADGAILPLPHNRAVVGIHFDEILKVRGAEKPRVFCLAAGAIKAGAVHAALKANAMSDLIIDEALATELLALIGQGN